MPHTDPEILALLALGESAGTAADEEHNASCAHCRSELARLTEVTTLARDGDVTGGLESPPPRVWEQIAAATGIAAAPAASNGAAGHASAPAGGDGNESGCGNEGGRGNDGGRDGSVPGRLPARWRRGRLAAGLAGAAAGLVIGIGAAAGISQLGSAPAPAVIARFGLRPLPQFPRWRGADGTAVMRGTGSSRVLAITLRAPREAGFYEVWLLARDGVSMISLGDLNASRTGSFAIPPGVDLRNYSRIDISLQAFNGSTQHSKTSVVRGTLPPAAMSTAADAAGAAGP